MFTGVPVSSSIDPACAAKASGMSSCDVGMPAREATTTTSGSRAATAPLTLMSAVTPATSSEITTSRVVRRVPARAMTFCPAHAVTPVASRDSLTTNRAAMNSTVGSPKPASACGRVRTPVKNSASETPIATMPRGIRLLTKATIASSRISSVATTGSTGSA